MIGNQAKMEGCQFRILVSLRAKRHQPWRSRLGLHVKKFNMCIVCVLTWSLLRVKSLGYPRISLFQGFNSKFPTIIPTPFICGIPPPPRGKFKDLYCNSKPAISSWIHILFDAFSLKRVTYKSKKQYTKSGVQRSPWSVFRKPWFFPYIFCNSTVSKL